MTTQSDNQTHNHTTTIAPYSSVQYLPALDTEAIQRALMAGDISKLSPADRVQFYAALCHSTGLNVLTGRLSCSKARMGPCTGTPRWAPPNSSASCIASPPAL